MHNIEVTEISSDGNEWVFKVVVDEVSNHTVTVPRDYYKKLTNGDTLPANLVKKSFEFLLERESAEAILSSFELPLIQRYFSDYEREIEL